MTISLNDVSSNGLGLMTVTARPVPIPKEDAFAAMQRAIEINLPKKTFFNGGEFYGLDYLNLVYIKGFFEKFPEQRKNVIVSVKGALPNFVSDVSREGITKSIDNILKYIPDLEIFEPARLDPARPFDETVAALDEAVDAGKIKAYTFSEISANTLSQVYKLAKHKPIGVEVEFSLITRNISTNGLAAVAGELGVPIIAYSPIGGGLLTGQVLSPEDIPEGDFRGPMERFSAENMSQNKKLIMALTSLAKAKGVTPAQISIAWVKYHSGKTLDGVKYPAIIPIPSSTSVKRVDENFASVELTEKEFNTLQEMFASGIAGGRYGKGFTEYLNV